MKRSIFHGTVAALACIAGMTSASAADVTVIHGIDGADLGLPSELPVNIAINRGCALEGVEFSNMATIEAAPGRYLVRVYLDGDERAAGEACPGTLVLSTSLEVAFGENLSVIAHLTDDGTITTSRFVNDVRTAGGNARVIVRHTADAPAVDVYAAPGVVLFGDLANGQQGKADVPSGTYSVAVNPAGAPQPVFGPVDVDLPADQLTIVYAVASLGGGTFTVLAQALPLPN